MPQGFNGSDVNLSQKTGGSGDKAPRHGKDKGSLSIDAPNWPSQPGKSGPNRQEGFGRKVKQHTQSTGL